MILFVNILILLCCTIYSGGIASDLTDSQQKQDCTDIARDDTTLLVFSTLGGGLTAVDPLTSEIRWQIDDEPAVKVPIQADIPVPQYLPDPRDGSLYQLGDLGGLKKMPYTIPQLVASAPCRSSDGILYSGKKKDTWFLIDPKTGKREKVLGFGAPSNSKDTVGWATSRSIYLGRTQYTILMYDSLSSGKNTKPWNVTFFDYASHSMAPEVSKEYEWLHLTGSASGLIVTLDRRKGNFIWEKQLKTPIVAVFLLRTEGLLSVPFTTVSDETLKNILEFSRDGQKSDIKLFQSLYVGEHPYGLYALPSLIDKNTATISSDPRLPVNLLEGPHNNDDLNLIYLNSILQQNNINKNYHNNKIEPNDENNNNQVIVLGHYQMPKINNDLTLSVSGSKQTNIKTLEPYDNSKELLTQNSIDYEVLNLNKNNLDNNVVIQVSSEQNRQQVDVVDDNNNNNNNNYLNLVNVLQNTSDEINETDKDQYSSTSSNTNTSDRHPYNILFKYPSESVSKLYFVAKNWLNNRENKILQLIIIIVFGGLVALLFHLKIKLRTLERQTGSQTRSTGSSSDRTNSSTNSYQELIDLGEGEIKVGKITFQLNEVLGKGCEGTFVFKGKFEKRDVAVKRLLPECFTFADREVALLSESDAHENVVRYYCTEQDRQFRYIAVELCAATLQDYTEGRISPKEVYGNITIRQILKQATSGLMHLHSLNIVHRDIKPQNVLLSLPSNNSEIRVMISDFGLCKKLNFGKTSISHRSGITGTEGWIAPEMLKEQRTTTSIDIFSLGCVFYYVISKGDHPFGDTIKRQLNVLAYDYELKYLNGGEITNEKVLAVELITDMISRDPLRRPPARAILNHPFFWSEEKVLHFLQDVSDRVEKSDYFVEPLRTLEKNSKFIVHNDWIVHLGTMISDDLRKYRAYHGCSIRDLLRALRNKKHHYHELTNEVKSVLGSLPTEFVHYWLSKFPRLLSHTFHALQLCSTEITFKIYYDSTFVFTKPNYFYEITEDYLPAEPVIIRNTAKKYRKITKQDKPLNLSLNTSDQFTPAKKIYRKGYYNFHRFSEDAHINSTNDNNGDKVSVDKKTGNSSGSNASKRRFIQYKVIEPKD